MDINELQKKVIEFRDARDWEQYHNPKDLAISLMLEVAELLEVFQWKDPQEVESTKSDPESRRKVKEEDRIKDTEDSRLRQPLGQGKPIQERSTQNRGRQDDLAVVFSGDFFLHHPPVLPNDQRGVCL
jgi:NTP pyrophosphatase (non-canonical NTP hydrolase)